MSIEPELIERVNLSYGRCIASPDFFTDFYNEFLQSSPEIKPHFANTNMDKQKALLRDGITCVIIYSKAADKLNSFAKDKLERIGKIHSHGQHNIEPRLYPLWTKSLLNTIRKHDKQFSPQLEQDWKKIIEPAVSLLISHY